MIETRQMTVEDFIVIMAQNANIYPEFDNRPDEQKRYLANVNIITGKAESFFDEGRLVGVGGIRYVGLGEGWFITLPAIRKKKPLTLVRQTKKFFVKARDEHNLRRVFATTKISKNFLRHLEFEPLPDVSVWTRQ